MRTHGTHSCYVGGCRCESCRTGHAAYEMEAKRRRAEWQAQDPYRQRVDTLRELVRRATLRPIPISVLADKAGVNENTVRRFRRGSHLQHNTYHAIREALLELLPSQDPTPSGADVAKS